MLAVFRLVNFFSLVQAYCYHAVLESSLFVAIVCIMFTFCNNFFHFRHSQYYIYPLLIRHNQSISSMNSNFLDLTLYTLISVCIFSILSIIHFLKCRQREFVQQSRASFIGDHFPYSCDLYVCVIQGRYCKQKLDASHSYE